MPRFQFVAMDSKGAETEGVLDAANQTEAVSMIRAKGMFPTRVSALGGGGGGKSRQAPRRGAPAQAAGGKKGALQMELKMPEFLAGRLKAKDLMVFTRQLATLIEAGLPLLRGLRILLQQEKKPSAPQGPERDG